MRLRVRCPDGLEGRSGRVRLLDEAEAFLG